MLVWNNLRQKTLRASANLDATGKWLKTAPWTHIWPWLAVVESNYSLCQDHVIMCFVVSIQDGQEAAAATLSINSYKWQYSTVSRTSSPYVGNDPQLMTLWSATTTMLLWLKQSKKHRTRLHRIKSVQSLYTLQPLAKHATTDILTDSM